MAKSIKISGITGNIGNVSEGEIIASVRLSGETEFIFFGVMDEPTKIISVNETGTYIVSLTDLGVPECTETREIYIEVEDPCDDFNVEIEVPDPEEVTHTVTFRVRDESNNPLNNAEVQFDGKTKQTGSDGLVVFEDVEAASAKQYTVTKDGYGSVTASISVNSDKFVNVTLQEAQYKVTFNVKDESEEPIENAKVVLNGLEKETDENGVVVFEDLVGGTYSYSISKVGYLDVSAIPFLLDEDRTIDVTLNEQNITTNLKFDGITADLSSGEAYRVSYSVRDESDVVVASDTFNLSTSTPTRDRNHTFPAGINYTFRVDSFTVVEDTPPTFPFAESAAARIDGITGWRLIANPPSATFGQDQDFDVEIRKAVNV